MRWLLPQAGVMRVVENVVCVRPGEVAERGAKDEKQPAVRVGGRDDGVRHWGDAMMHMQRGAGACIAIMGLLFLWRAFS